MMQLRSSERFDTVGAAKEHRVSHSAEIRPPLKSTVQSTVGAAKETVSLMVTPLPRALPAHPEASAAALPLPLPLANHGAVALPLPLANHGAGGAAADGIITVGASLALALVGEERIPAPRLGMRAARPGLPLVVSDVAQLPVECEPIMWEYKHFFSGS